MKTIPFLKKIFFQYSYDRAVDVNYFFDEETKTLFAKESEPDVFGFIPSVRKYLKALALCNFNKEKPNTFISIKTYRPILENWELGCLDISVIDNFELFESHKGPSFIEINNEENNKIDNLKWIYKDEEVLYAENLNFVEYFNKRIVIPSDEKDQNGIETLNIFSEKGIEYMPKLPGILGEQLRFEWFDIIPDTHGNFKIKLKFKLEEPKSI